MAVVVLAVVVIAVVMAAMAMLVVAGTVVVLAVVMLAVVMLAVVLLVGTGVEAELIAFEKAHTQQQRQGHLSFHSPQDPGIALEFM